MAISEHATFGQMIRQRRQEKGLSQEALAATALGNADRKSFISAIENNRLTKVTPATAQRLSAALEIAREEIPESLRWPAAEGESAIERRLKALEDGVGTAPDRRMIADFINRQLAETVGLSLLDRYHRQLQDGLQGLRRWTGRPFSLQSLFMSYSIGLLYVVAAALLSYGAGNVAVGAVRLLQSADRAGSLWAAITPIVSLVFLLGTSLVCWMIVSGFGRTAMTPREAALRLAFAALLAGVCCGSAALLGVDSLAVAVLFAVPCFAAASTLKPWAASLAGAAGGLSAAPISAFFQPVGQADFALTLIEGFVIGSVIGSIAGWTSSKMRLSIPHLGGGKLAGAGAGLASGGVLCLGAIMAAGTVGAADTTTLGIFAVIWLALPMANALLDYLSLGISHAIARFISDRRLSGAQIVFLAVLDLCVALFMMVLTVTTIGIALAALSVALNVDTLSLVFLESSVSDPWGQGLWVTIMVLTTCVWTWLHFAGVVAPLAAGLLARLAERAAIARLDSAKSEGKVAISAGVLIGLRAPIFYVTWVGLALLPAVFVLTRPEIISGLLQLGLQQARFLLVG